MIERSDFEGLAGKTLRDFLSPTTLPTLLPTGVLSVLLGAAALTLSRWLRLPQPLPLAMVLIFNAPVLCRYALAARTGRLGAGFFSLRVKEEPLRKLVGRFAALCLGWGALTTVFGNAIARQADQWFAHPAALGSAQQAASAAVLLLAAGGLLVLATVSLFVALITGSLREIVTPEPWRWLWSRREDLPAFYAALVGGLVLFCTVVVPFFYLLAALAFALGPRLGWLFSVLAYLAPAVAAPVLWGRLTGAFVLSESDEIDRLERVTSPTSLALMDSLGSDGPTVPSREHYPPGVPVRPDPLAVNKAVRNLTKRALTDLPGAIAEAETMRKENPRHVGVVAELAKLYRAAGKREEAVATASEAIAQALLAGASPIAVEMYMVFQAERNQLLLSTPALEQLARTLLAQGSFAEAFWCFGAAVSNGGDLATAQKGFISVADAACTAGSVDQGIAIYDFFVKTYPRSSLSQHCQTAMKAAKAKS